MSSPVVVGAVVLALLTAAWLLFAAIELAGLALPGFHTISYLAHNSPPLRHTLVGFVFAFGIWLNWHLGQPVPK